MRTRRPASWWRGEDVRGARGGGGDRGPASGRPRARPEVEDPERRALTACEAAVRRLDVRAGHASGEGEGSADRRVGGVDAATARRCEAPRARGAPQYLRAEEIWPTKCEGRVDLRRET